jgi:putative addiction module component, TIGR02574 family
MTIQKLKEAVRNLSPQERILFVKYVLDTLAEDTDVKNSGEPLSDDWKEELEKRSTSYKNDSTKTVTWEEVKTKLIRKNS